jgi:hypothetical protein
MTAFARVDNRPSEYLRGLRGRSDFVDDIGVYVVLEGGRVELLETVLYLFLGSEFKEVFKSVPLLVVNVDGELGVLVPLILISQEGPIL